VLIRELRVPMSPASSDERCMAVATRGDPVEAVARVATARRDRLLRIHRRRLRWEDLEDCYSQATLELVARAQRDPFASQEHILNALEQKFSSRIDDRRRAIGGRSPIETAIAKAVPVETPESGAVDLEDRSAEVVSQVAGRLEVRRLREVAAELTDDQRLVLACQVSLGMDCSEFCARFGWSAEKFRKVAQRGRARLRALVAEYHAGERCERLEPDLVAYLAGAGSEVQMQRAAEHVANCVACASRLRALDRASRQVAALLPVPVVAKAGLLAKVVGGFALVARRLLTVVGRGPTEFGAAGVAGGSAVGAGAVKLGVAAACLAGAAGAICSQGLGIEVGRATHHHARPKVEHVRPVASTAPPRAQLSVAGGRTQTASGTPVTGAAASAQAHREFGGGSARAASLAPSQSSGSGTGAAAALRSARAASEFRPSSSVQSSSASSASSSSGRSTASVRAASQAQAEFSGFER
jgi:DNA-directed RNA polymerase specialized sigma24 family protein